MGMYFLTDDYIDYDRILGFYQLVGPPAPGKSRFPTIWFIMEPSGVYLYTTKLNYSASIP